MKSRPILINVDSIIKLLFDYLGEDNIPADTIPLAIQINPQEKNKLAILCESSSWSPDMAPLNIHFDIRRIFTTGG